MRPREYRAVRLPRLPNTSLQAPYTAGPRTAPCACCSALCPPACAGWHRFLLGGKRRELSFVCWTQARGAALDVQTWEQSIEASWDRPGGVTQDVQHRRQQQATHDDRVEEHRRGQRQPELLDDTAFAEHEG